MPLWLQIVFAVVCGVQIPFAAWIVCKVFAVETRMETRLAELAGQVAERKHECAERLTWLREMDGKLDKVQSGVSRIEGVLIGQGADRKDGET